MDYILKWIIYIFGYLNWLTSYWFASNILFSDKHVYRIHLNVINSFIGDLKMIYIYISKSLYMLIIIEFVDYDMILSDSSIWLKFRNQTLCRDKLLTMHITWHFKIIKNNSGEENKKSWINKNKVWVTLIDWLLFNVLF